MGSGGVVVESRSGAEVGGAAAGLLSGVEVDGDGESVRATPFEGFKVTEAEHAVSTSKPNTSRRIIGDVMRRLCMSP